jgi:hypothetical protein
LFFFCFLFFVFCFFFICSFPWYPASLPQTRGGMSQLYMLDISRNTQTLGAQLQIHSNFFTSFKLLKFGHEVNIISINSFLSDSYLEHLKRICISSSSRVSVFYDPIEKYSFECVKFYTSWFFLRQVATGHFVDLTPLGIFFNLL